MAARRRNDKKRAGVIDMQWQFLKGEPLPEKSFEAFAIRIDVNKNNEELWNLHRDVILAEHVRDKPGTRPALWWAYTAPRLPLGTFKGWFIDGKLPEPRKRLGGIGTAAYETTAIGPSFSFGIADAWVGIDSEDPPTFESQAAYLNRHGILLAGEERRSSFEPDKYHTAIFSESGGGVADKRKRKRPAVRV